MKKSYICKTCAFVTDDKTKEHNCADVRAVVHEEGEFKPRSGVDHIIARCIRDIKENITWGFDNYPQELENIHPEMLIALMITNVAINLFFDTFDKNAPISDKRQALHDLMSKVTHMSMHAVDATITAMAQTNTKH